MNQAVHNGSFGATSASRRCAQETEIQDSRHNRGPSSLSVLCRLRLTTCVSTTRGRTCLRERFAIPLFEATQPTAHPLSLSNGSVSCPPGRTTRLHTRSYSPGVLRDDIRAGAAHEAPPDSGPHRSRIYVEPSFPHGTGIPEKSGWPQIATCLILDGWQRNTGCI